MNAYANLPTKEIFAILDSKIREYQAQIEAVEEVKRKLSGEEPEEQSNRYASMTKRDAIQDVLRRNKREMRVEEIGAALKAGGMDLGERGFRDVRTAITMNDQLFYWNGEHANLREWKNRAA